MRRRRASDSNINEDNPENPSKRKLVPPLIIHTSATPDHSPSAPVAPARNFPKSQTVDFRLAQTPTRGGFSDTSGEFNNHADDEGLRRRRLTIQTTGLPRSHSSGNAPLHSSIPLQSAHPLYRTNTKHTGFGGFPNPLVAVAAYAKDKILSTPHTPMPRTTTLASAHSAYAPGSILSGVTKPVSYITFDAVVGRNSKFKSLTAAQRDELGGVEYRVCPFRVL